jgi:hypothetical protein
MKDLKEGLKEGEAKMKQLAEQERSHIMQSQQIQVQMLELKGRLDLLKELIKDQNKPKGGKKNGGNT